MSCTLCRNVVFRSGVRCYSAQTNPSVNAKSGDIEVSTLPSKIVVASVESSLPISRISILFRAGSRHETYDSLGSSHMMRYIAGLTTTKSSTFGITKNIQQIGASLAATSDRETLCYTLEVTKNHLETGLKYLEHVATAPAFKPWEINDNLARLQLHLKSVPYEVRAVELLHKAAYHNGLGNSIFCPKYQIGNISAETLQHFFSSHCTSNKCAVVGVGIDHRALTGFAQCLDLHSNTRNDQATKYHGGNQIHVNRVGNLAHVAIAGEGAALSNLKEAIAFAVLQYAAGVEPSLKRGNVNGALGKVVSKHLGDSKFKFSTFNVSYTDSGLFGFVLTAGRDNIGKVVDAAIKALKSGSISSEDIARGKNQLKARCIEHYENGGELVTTLGQQCSLLGNTLKLQTVLADIDAISSSDIQAAGRKVASSKLCIGAVGNLATLPHVDDLA